MKWYNSDIVVLMRRLLTVYVALAVLRIVFYFYNRSLLGPVESPGELWQLTKGALVFDTVSVIYAYSLLIILSLLPFRTREKGWYQRTLFWIFTVINSIVVAINTADIVYFNYAHKRFTADEIFFAGNDNSFRLLIKFSLENWYLILLAALLIWMPAACWKTMSRPSTPIRNPLSYFMANLITLVGVIALCIGGMRGGFAHSTRPITLSNATQYTPSPRKANMILSNPFCIIRTAGIQNITYTEYYGPQQLDSIFTPYHYPSGKGSIGRRNVVIFVLESFSAEHSAFLNPDLYPDGKGFTPFLDSLMQCGYTLTDAFANGRKSIDALPSVLASTPSFKTPFILTPQSLGESMPMPKILQSEGYATSFFCGSPRGSMGFGAYANLSGIDARYGREDYEAAHGTDDFDGYWGIWDEPFFGFMGEKLGETKQPFFSTIFTLTSHHPFVVPEKYISSLPAGRTKVHRGVAYTDMAIRRFFERFGSEEWFHSTIFVFTADHVSSEVFADKTRTSVGNSHIILFYYTPDGSIRKTDPYTSQQIDIMPTVLGMVGYDKPYFAFGRDVRNEVDRMPMAVNYMDQSFQIITDSVSLLFDESRVLSAHSRTDTLMRRNIAPRGGPDIEQAEAELKAVIQQYYSHMKRKKFVVGQ